MSGPPPFRTPIVEKNGIVELRAWQRWMVDVSAATTASSGNADARYVLLGAAAGLPNAQNLGVLDDGFLYATVTGGGAMLSSKPGLLTASVTLTDADILALPSTPFEILPSPGANRRIKLLAPPTLHLVNSLGPYTGTDPAYATLAVQWAAGAWSVNPIVNDSTSTPPLSDLTKFLETAAGSSSWVVELGIPYAASVPTATTGWIQNFTSTSAQEWSVQGANKALQLVMDNNGSTSDLTGGNGYNSLTIHVYYLIEAIA